MGNCSCIDGSQTEAEQDQKEQKQTRTAAADAHHGLVNESAIHQTQVEEHVEQVATEAKQEQKEQKQKQTPHHHDPVSDPANHPKREHVEQHLASLSDPQGHLIDISQRLPADERPAADQVPARKTLVMDMDETMMHSTDGNDGNDEKVKPDEWLSDIGRKVWFRPGVLSFLEEMSKHFELVLFTAGTQDYAMAVMAAGLDSAGTTFSRSFYQQDATDIEPPTFQDGQRISWGGNAYFFFKDLRKVRGDLENVVLIDDTRTCFMSEVQKTLVHTANVDFSADTWTRDNCYVHNAIWIPRWNDPQNMQQDNALQALIPFLVNQVAPAKDVRDVLDMRKPFKTFAPDYNDTIPQRTLSQF